ncbi:uncharacterized protein RJT20DRAFT_1335 [Scheffersomyces xylosifermentans]|uniref:uncharacterized protein n=1 Tax=Scheffersomyces xylosifermentans TaxID=1304137 RepID=UPI00315D171D
MRALTLLTLFSIALASEKKELVRRSIEEISKRDSCDECATIAKSMVPCLPNDGDLVSAVYSEAFQKCFCVGLDKDFWDGFADCIANCKQYQGPEAGNAADIEELFCGDVETSGDLDNNSTSFSTSASSTSTSASSTSTASTTKSDTKTANGGDTLKVGSSAVILAFLLF